MTEHQLLPMDELRERVWARAMGLCEHPECGLPLRPSSWECHHRKLRSRGGPDCACNALALHPRCHTQGPTAVHDFPTRYDLAGLLVASWEQPELMRVQLPFQPFGQAASALLSCGGTYT